MKLKNATALFEITNKCNLRCKHCYKENLDGNDLTLEQIQTILEKLSAFGISHLILTGGEPLLRKDLFQIIDFAIKNEIKNCAINTNGILLDDPKILNEIKDRLDIISSIPTSFDGAKSETHDYIRGDGQFNRLIKTLDKDIIADLPFGINVTIGKWNFQDFDDYFALYDQLNAFDINFGIFLPIGRGKDMKNQILSRSQCLSLIQNSIQKKFAGYHVELCSLPYSALYEKNISGDCCNIFTDFVTITAQGNIIPCILYDFNCGSLLEMEMDEIFSKPLVKMFREPKKLKKKMSGYCNICSKFKICKGGCNLATYAITGSIYNSDPLCSLQIK